MDLKGIFSFLGAVATSAVARQATEELKAWTPCITDRLVRFAVARLPPEERARFDEEWRSHIADVPGEIGKLAVASGYIIAAVRISAFLHDFQLSTMLRALDRVVGLFCAPGLFVLSNLPVSGTIILFFINAFKPEPVLSIIHPHQSLSFKLLFPPGLATFREIIEFGYVGSLKRRISKINELKKTQGK